jgi:hypothetical protein
MKTLPKITRSACRLIILFALAAAIHAAGSGDDAIDARRLRELHTRVKNGETLTPQDQTYYDRGKAERVSKGKTRKKEPGTAPASEAKPAATLSPLCDMAAEDRYKGEDGGLYGGGRNAPPELHLKAATEMAATIQPLDANGKPSPGGKIVLLTHGMSNTTNESERFIELANADPRKSPSVLLIDGAQGGIDSRKWVADTHTRRDSSPWETLEKRVKAAGASPQQVQVIWMKHAVARPAQYGDFPKHAMQLKEDTVEILHMLKERFPNLKIAYLSSRSYGGYASTDLNPEPFAYESAFAVRWLIQDQIKGETRLDYHAGQSPLVLWGPYLWADGAKGRKADDLIYRREDFRDDGTHPSDSGRQKVAEQLVKFFTSDPTASGWFVKH